MSMADPSLLLSRITSSPGAKGKKSPCSVDEALERQKTPVRQNSYSDSTDGDEEVEEAFQSDQSRHAWNRSVYQNPSSSLALGSFSSSGHLDDSLHSAFYSPNLSVTRLDLSKRYRISARVYVSGIWDLLHFLSLLLLFG